MADRQMAVIEECVEPELISPGGSGYRPRAEETQEQRPPEKPGLLTRVKIMLACGLGLLGAGLFVSGALLTSTVIGAIIGIPLMLAGALVFIVLLKLLASGSKNTFVFRRF
ncbi:MAG: hypothetical protein M0011_10485 [Elusimicrobia bacterium]|nr:hypothetical protein [Elusimicrobiota bacterium]